MPISTISTISTISAQEAQAKIQQGAVLIDIRNSDEHRREHIEGAMLQPLSQLQATGLSENIQAKEIIFHCKSGMRTKNASQLLSQIAPQGSQVFLLEGGIDGWKKVGFATKIDAKQPLELMRQVQIAAGSLALLGAVLGYTASPAFHFLSGFVGAGLLFAGVTGFCGMARLLAVMPWNKTK
ncbi:hypothetical protein A1D22_05285 [Pasteurellaceae bacterium LFhippo2]|nr:hypothetical protein [Pasteurellaceae bacterium LFhippo2]